MQNVNGHGLNTKVYKFQCMICFLQSGIVSNNPQDAPTCCNGEKMTAICIEENMETTIEGVKVRYNPDGKVMWMEDWGKCDEFVKKGHFTKKFYKHCYGHTDFYVK